MLKEVPKYFKTNRPIITYSWIHTSVKESKTISHKICGHNFEAFELLYVVPDSIFMIPDFEETANRVIKALEIKYTKARVDKFIEENRIQFGRPAFIINPFVIICDGQMPTNVIINSKKLTMILCGKDLWWLESIHKKTTKTIKNFLGKELNILYDYRIPEYKEALNKIDFTSLCPNQSVEERDYIKNIDFNIYDQTTSTLTEDKLTFLVYATGNCRNFKQIENDDTIQEIFQIVKDYDIPKNHDTLKQKKLLIVSDQALDTNTIKIFQSENIEIEFINEKDLPIDNFFNRFDIYIYTPTPKNWDCSSRLIPECNYFNKKVILTESTKKQLDTNNGLKRRVLDFFPELIRTEK